MQLQTDRIFITDIFLRLAEIRARRDLLNQTCAHIAEFQEMSNNLNQLDYLVRRLADMILLNKVK